MDKDLLIQKLYKFCAPWLQRADPSLTFEEILQHTIQQVLPGKLGVQIEYLGNDKIIGTVPYRQDTANVVGFMHGGTIFATGDTLAGAFLWAISEGNQYAVTISANIQYLQPLKEGNLRCTVTEKSRNGRKVNLAAAFTDEANQDIAAMELEYILMTY